MNRAEAKAIAETITNEQLHAMFVRAKALITDWTARADVNKGMTKGAAWNILTNAFKVDEDIHIMAKINMIWEFGEFLPTELRQRKVKEPKVLPDARHQEPKFDLFD